MLEQRAARLAAVLFSAVLITALCFGQPALAEPDAAVIAAQPGVSTIDLPESSAAECQNLREKRLSEITAGWTLCTEDSQCVVAPGVCGWPKAIHSSHLRGQEVLNQCLGPIINCAAPWNQPTATEARCEAGHCRIGAAAQ